MVDVCSNSTVSMVAKTHMVVHGLAHRCDQGMPINLLAPAPRPRSTACWNLDTKRKRLAPLARTAASGCEAHAHEDTDTNVITRTAYRLGSGAADWRGVKF